MGGAEKLNNEFDKDKINGKSMSEIQACAAKHPPLKYIPPQDEHSFGDRFNIVIGCVVVGLLVLSMLAVCIIAFWR